MQRNYYVYILANASHTTLYIGVTNDLQRRMYEHKHPETESFTKRYHVNQLMYYEQTTDPESAIQREKHLKRWNRTWKERLIEKDNPNWEDLSADWFQE